jgi:hypothetical protein
MTHHNNTLPFAECHYAECRILLVMLSALMLIVAMLSAVAPLNKDQRTLIKGEGSVQLTSLY